MTNTEKMTNAKALAFVLENFELPADVKEKIQNIYNSTTKKSASKKPSKNAEENKALGVIVTDILANASEPMTITDMQNASAELKALSNQKVTAVVRMLIKSGEVVKIVDGKKSRFTLATED